MIRVTIWNEYRQENENNENAIKIRAIHPKGIHETIAEFLSVYPELEIKTATLDMPDCGLSEPVLNETDVLVWWAHVAHEDVPDDLVERIHQRILKGMGFIALHSAHMCKVLQRTLGTSGSLQWREGDFCRVWNLAPTHPIAFGIPSYFELPEEEMYGEYFDIPKPDDVVFTSWFSGGEVFRSGCTWGRGYGKVFYFQPGHETNCSYQNEYVQKVIYNAIKWANPSIKIDAITCPHAIVKPEDKRR